MSPRKNSEVYKKRMRRERSASLPDEGNFLPWCSMSFEEEDDKENTSSYVSAPLKSLQPPVIDYISHKRSFEDGPAADDADADIEMTDMDNNEGNGCLLRVDSSTKRSSHRRKDVPLRSSSGVNGVTGLGSRGQRLEAQCRAGSRGDMNRRKKDAKSGRPDDLLIPLLPQSFARDRSRPAVPQVERQGLATFNLFGEMEAEPARDDARGKFQKEHEGETTADTRSNTAIGSPLSPPRPPQVRLGMRKRSVSRRADLFPMPQCSQYEDEKNDDVGNMTVSYRPANAGSFLFSDDEFRDSAQSSTAYSPTPFSSSRMAAPMSRTSLTATPKEIQSPHWSKPVLVNPFSPVPAECLLGGSFDNSFDSSSSSGGGMYYSIRGSPLRISSRKQRRAMTESLLQETTPPAGNNHHTRSAMSGEPTFLGSVRSSPYGANKGDDTSPMDVMSFLPLPRPTPAKPFIPPPPPAKSRVAFQRRRLDDGFSDLDRNDVDDSSEAGITHLSSNSPPSLSRKVRKHISPPQCRCPPTPRPQSPLSPSSSSRFEEDFQSIGQLGSGSFGTVYKCISRVDGCLYAVKVVKRMARGELDRQHMLREVHALAALCNKAETATFHIVRYHQAWMEDNRLYIQTEFCTSTLQQEMARGSLDEKRRFKLLREMLLALSLIHRNDMVHLDIKPDNIFIKDDQFKLGDFGLASKSTGNKDVEEGDARYMSKELLTGDKDDLTKCDVFSLGATMYEICLGRPLPPSGDQWHSIRSGSLPFLDGTTLELQNIIREMMHPDPKCRPSAAELLRRRELLSEDEKLLILEKEKVEEANKKLKEMVEIQRTIHKRSFSVF